MIKDPVARLVNMAGTTNRLRFAGILLNSHVTQVSMMIVIRQLPVPCTSPDTHGAALDGLGELAFTYHAQLPSPKNASAADVVLNRWLVLAVAKGGDELLADIPMSEVGEEGSLQTRKSRRHSEHRFR